jgi:hypothetical protein
MPEKTQNSIEKPWAIYGRPECVFNIGKVIREDKEGEEIKRLWLIEFEGGSRFSPEDQPQVKLWNPRYVKTFDKSYKAIAYFLVHQMRFNPPYDKKSAINEFLHWFPSEQANLETLLAQSKPKCTRTREDSLGFPDTWLESVGPGFQEYHK